MVEVCFEHLNTDALLDSIVRLIKAAEPYKVPSISN